MNSGGILLLMAAVPLVYGCNGGGGGSYNEGSDEKSVIYDNCRNLSASGTSICGLNRCHRQQMTISKISITAGAGTTLTCTEGGVGDFKFVMKVSGTGPRTFQAKVWGDFGGKLLQRKSFYCLQEKLYKGGCA